MPEASIIITAQDKYSSQIKAMANTTKAFDKTTDGLESKLRHLDKTQDTLSDKITKSKKTIGELQKEFDKTGDAAVGLRLETERFNLHTMTRELDLTRRAVREAERDIRKMTDTTQQFKQASGGISDVATAFAANGIGQMVGDLVQSLAISKVSSAFGTNAGSMFSNALSSAVSGAAIGTAVLQPGLGTVVGAGLGAVVGAATGWLQNEQNRDDAFKGYVQDQTQSVLSQRSSDIQAGSSIAATREGDLRALTSILGTQSAAREHQRAMIEVGRTPPFSYDTAMALSREMLGLGLSTDQTNARIGSLANAAAALDLSESQATSIVSTLEAARLTGKLESRVTKSLAKMGLNVYEALGETFDISPEEAAAKLSELDVDKAIQGIYDYMGRRFAGAAEGLTDTYGGAKGILASYEEDMKAAYGEGYNEERSKGLNEQSEWLSGASGKAQEEANKALGAWQASLENRKEEYIRGAVDAAMAGDEYQKAKAEGDAAEMGRLIAAAKVQGNSDYLAKEGKDQELADQIALADAIRNDPATKAAYQQAGYTMGLEFSKGMAAAVQATTPTPSLPQFDSKGQMIDYEHMSAEELSKAGKHHAAGLDRVPYDGYAAILHEGERVLTAREARGLDSGGGSVVVNVSGNTFEVRQDSDVDAIAQAIARGIQARRQQGMF